MDLWAPWAGGYRRQLGVFLQGEVFGEQLYDTWSRVARDPHRVDQLRHLRGIEQRTRALLEQALRREHVRPRQPLVAAALGDVTGLILGELPWRWGVRGLRWMVLGTLRSLQRFARRHRHRDPALAEALLAHEQLQARFCARELGTERA
jgi:hypothetical protein